jgi:hypothetical protein
MSDLLFFGCFRTGTYVFNAKSPSNRPSHPCVDDNDTRAQLLSEDGRDGKGWEGKEVRVGAASGVRRTSTENMHNHNPFERV